MSVLECIIVYTLCTMAVTLGLIGCSALAERAKRRGWFR